MSEGRQIALMLVGLLVLSGIGIGAAVLLPEGCEGLTRDGDLTLGWSDDPGSVLGVDAEAAQQLAGLGEQLGVGPFRGAVAAPGDVTVDRGETGLFLRSGGDVVVARPGFEVVSTALSTADFAVVPEATTLGLVADDGEAAFLDDEFEQARCGVVEQPGAVLDVRGGVAAAQADGRIRLLGVDSGDELAAADAAPAWAAVRQFDLLHAGQDGTVRSLGRTGEQIEVGDAGGSTELLDVTDDRVLLRDEAGRAAVADVAGVPAAGVGSGEADPDAFTPEPLAEQIDDAVLTPRGAVLLSSGTLSTDRGASADLPDGVTVRSLHTTRSGYVAALAETDGATALLVWGPDADP